MGRDGGLDGRELDDDGAGRLGQLEDGLGVAAGEEATAAARSLAAEAETMARQITRFRTGGGATPNASPVAQLQERAAVAGRQIAAASRINPPRRPSGPGR